MKLFSWVLVVSSLGFSSLALANSCGKLVNQELVPLGDFAVKLEKHNGKRINFPRTRLTTDPIEASGFGSLSLSPGKHEFRGYALCPDGHYCKRSNYIGGSLADEVNFVVNIEAGKSYKLAARPVEESTLLPGKRFDVYIVKEKEVICDGKAKAAIPAVQSDKPELTASL